METLAGKALNDIANLVSEKWYSGMGLIGLIVVMWVMLAGTPHDDILIGAIGTTMIGFGFGEAEIRTFQKQIDPSGRWEITTPIRRMTKPGICLYALGVTAAITTIGRTIYLVI
jgi:hypothetical protein